MTKELSIDIILMINIIFCLLITYRKENSQSYEYRLTNIIFNYCVKGSMVFDVLSVVPTLATNQSNVWYSAKLIRFLKIGETYKAINGATKIVL